MKVEARLRYLRLSPRKVRGVANVIRGKRVPEAERILGSLRRRAAGPIAKALASAIANAKHDFQVSSPESLVVSGISVDGGPPLHRRRPRARGTAFPIRKRTSHVHVVLESTEPSSRLRPRKAEIAFAKDEAIEGEAEAGRPAGAERAPLRSRPRVLTKPRDFIRRVFRRKVI